MAAFPQQPMKDPVVAREFATTRETLRFEPVQGTFVSKHRGGKPISLTRVTGLDAIVFKTPLNEDLDGAPTSYTPPIDWNNLAPKPGLNPIEKTPRNATNRNDSGQIFFPKGVGNDFEWAGVKSATPDEAAKAGVSIDDRDFLKDKNGRFPIFQPGNATQPRYYRPRTAMAMRNGEAVNSLTVPFAALSGSLRSNTGMELGDVGLAIRASTGKFGGFIYGDAGGKSSTTVGEYSRKLIRDVFGAPADDKEDICIISFPRSGAEKVARPELTLKKLAQRIGGLSQMRNTNELANLLAATVGEAETIMQVFAQFGYYRPDPASYRVP
jgi:hypothetical protein